MQAQQLTIAVERLNGDIRSITEQISGSDSRIAVLENDILRNEESIASLRSEIEAGEQDGAEADAALQRHRAVAAKMEAEGEKLAAEIDALNAELEQLAERQQCQRCPKGHPAGRDHRPDSQAHRSTGGTGCRRSRRGNGPSAPAGTGAGRAGGHRPVGDGQAGPDRHHPATGRC